MADQGDSKAVSQLGEDVYNIHIGHVTVPEGPGAASGLPRETGLTESDFLWCMTKKEEVGSESSAPPVPTVNVLSDSYDMSHKKRGHALLISNEKFSFELHRQGLGDRNGTKVDEKNLKKQLRRLGFEVKTYNDASALRMVQSCQDMAGLDHSECDCFVCVILTHGEEGIVYGRNKPVELKELVKPFRGNNCPSLLGKPKIFFIQACRGYQTDPGVDVNVMDAKPQDDIDAGRFYPDVIKLPVDADFLLAYSTVPGYYSWRNGMVGSWFIKALCEILEEHGTEMELMKLLTIVNRRVALNFRSSNPDNPDFHGMKQIPCITSMLTKDIYFSEMKSA